MGFLPDTQNCGLRMRWECQEHFPRHWLQRKPLVSDPGMHHGTCVTHVPWCMSGSPTHGGGENFSDIPDACATRNYAYLARGIYTNIITSFEEERCSHWTTCDYSKANETVDNEISLVKLHHYGARGVMLERFWDYLPNRTQCILYDDVSFEIMLMQCGVSPG